jgi:hypothetical protein
VEVAGADACVKRPEREQGRGAWLARLRGALECPRPRGAGPREGADLRMRLGGPGRRGRRDAAWRRRLEKNSQCHCSDVKISKNLNRSAQSGE